MASNALIFTASFLAMFFFLRSADAAIGSSNVFSMQSYGAHGDGVHDDTKALVDAWVAACSSAKPAVVLIPNGKKYLTRHTTLSGPCKSSIVLMVKGSLVASPERSHWNEETIRRWILFSGVTGLTVTGSGTIDGNGKIWWQNSCKTNSKLPCTEAPTALTFYSCKNLKVENLKVVNSQQIQISVEDCTDVKMSRLSITAPETSPNTDGIHITRSKNVHVTDSTIKTGDDCMSIEDGTENLHVKNMVCGPGHGISIGSLGDHNSEAHVTNVTVNNVRMYGTTNGARIKTWQGGRGHAKNIVFQNMVMDNVWNPIIIDQNYCDSATPCKQQKSAVEVSDVLFKNIRGTSASEEAITLHCSSSVPCHGITLENVKITVKGGSSDAKSTCQNAEWKKSGSVSPQPCGFRN
uniref:endo-polygalacturonase n=1 Tax=Leersia perrieri TaxID=77586 RepID=A0A0D9WWQ7_9ORYZ